MTDETPTVGALGGYTNNQMNREGIKKLVNKIDAVSDDVTDITTKLATKQDKLIAGEHITISEENVISADSSSYTAGNRITIANNEISVNDGWTECAYTDIFDNATAADYEYKITVGGTLYYGHFLVPNNYTKGLYIPVTEESSNDSMVNIQGIYIYNGVFLRNNSMTILRSQYHIDDYSGSTASFKYLDMDTDVEIDNTTIDNYIDSDDVCIKKFVVVPKSSSITGVLSASLIYPGMKKAVFGYYNSGSSYYNIGSSALTLNEIKNYIKNDTSAQLKSCRVTYSKQSYTSFKLYRRKKN